MQALTTVQKHAAPDVRRPNTINIEELFRAAMEKGPEIVERMMAVRRELNAEQAKAACDEAVREFQRTCPRIGKSKGVPDKFGNIAYKYAPLEEIVATISPILDKCGLSFSFDSDVTSQNGWVIASCEITHVGGHSFSKKVKLPLGTKTNIMSDTQQFSAALSFANRRVLCNALGIVTVGEDQDGRDPSAKQKSPMSKPEQPAKEPERGELVSQLWDLLAPVRGTANTWTEGAKWLRVHKILDDGKTIASLSDQELTVVIEKAEIVLKGE